MFYHLAMVFFSFCASAAGTFLSPQGVSPLAYKQAQNSRTGSVQNTGEETVAEQGVSFCESFLLGIKNVFAKFDKRLG